MSLYRRGVPDALAVIRNAGLADILEAVALLALDLVELRNLGLTSRTSENRAFQRSIVQVANRLRREAELSSEAQLSALAAARDKAREMDPARLARAVKEFGSARAGRLLTPVLGQA